MKSIPLVLVELELAKVKWNSYASWLGLQFSVVLPVLQPSLDSGNSRESGEFSRPFSGVGNSTSIMAS